MTQRRLAAGNATTLGRSEAALAALQRYATGHRCRQQTIVAHFTGENSAPPCGRCDVCRGESVPEAAYLAEEKAPVAELPAQDLDLIVAAVDRLRRPVGKGNLAKALRGSRAKSLSRGGLLTLPEYGQLAHHSEVSIVAAVESLLKDGRLARTGRKYPTVWIPGKPIRATAADDDAGATAPRPKPRRNSRYGGPVARELDNYRRRRARALKWKAYMVFQRNVILAVDREQPNSHAALARIPGLGPAKIERFGDDILEIVRRHGDRAD